MFQTHPALVGLQPAFAMSVFSEVLKIPRRSGHEDRLAAMVQQWARSHNWPFIMDEWKNVSVRVPGTPGYENAPSVTIQGHSDMVYVPDDDETVGTPIDVEVVNGFVQTKGQKRTLGADNSAAIALALNAAETCKVHGPIEILITSREEDDLGGAENWDPVFHQMTSRRLINVDTPLYGKIAVMSAGFQYVDAVLPLVRESEPARNCYLITLSGLLGGHSGDNIHEKRGNANKWMKSFLTFLPPGSRMVTFTGGSAGNSIPAQASVVVSIPDDYVSTDWQRPIQNYAEHCRKTLNNANVVLTIEEQEVTEPAMTQETHDTIMLIINESPDGVHTFSSLQENLPELSYTLAVIKHGEGGLHFKLIVRGADEMTMMRAADGHKHLFTVLGCNATLGHHSNAWMQEPGSPLVVAAQEAFRDLGTEAELRGFHCCLELATLIGVGDNRRYDSAVSIGAEVLDEHAVTERMDVVSFRKIARVLELMLEDIANGKA